MVKVRFHAYSNGIKEVKMIQRAFTIVEILVVVAVIATLVAILLVSVQGSTDAAKSIRTAANLKQIGSWMQLWSGGNGDYILPSQFDFVDEAAAGKAVSARLSPSSQDDNPHDDIVRGQYQGTWSDLLWVDNNLHTAYGLGVGLDGSGMDDNMILKWQFDSPDNGIFDELSAFEHPFRSALENTRGPEKGISGYFAANDFFDSRSDNDIGDEDSTSRVDKYYTYAMISSPAQSVYLIDSMAGETISDGPEPWVYDFDIDSEGQMIAPDAVTYGEVDYRNGGESNILLLDGAVTAVTPFAERGPQTEGSTDTSLFGKGFRVHQLTKRRPTK